MIHISLGMKRKGQDYDVGVETADPTSKLWINIFQDVDGQTPINPMGTSQKALL